MMGAAEKAELAFEEEEEAAAAVPARMMQALDFEHIGSLAAVAESLSPRSKWPRSKWQMALRSIRIVIIQAKINVLLPFGPLAITLHYLTGKHQGWVFLFSLIGITPLAERLGYATEQLGIRLILRPSLGHVPGLSRSGGPCRRVASVGSVGLRLPET